MDLRGRRLMMLGMVLFAIGLLTGLTISLGVFKNPRLALSTHLEGVLNGTYLVAVGLAWPRFLLTEGQKRVAFLLVAYGTVANWFFTLLGAAFGTKMLTPLAGAGYTAEQWQELLVAAGLTSLVVAMLGSTLLFIYGLRGAEPDSANAR